MSDVLVRCPECGNLSLDPRTGVCDDCESITEEERLDLRTYRRIGALLILFAVAAYVEVPL